MRHFLPASHSLNDISSAHIFLSLLQNSFFFFHKWFLLHSQHFDCSSVQVRSLFFVWASAVWSDLLLRAALARTLCAAVTPLSAAHWCSSKCVMVNSILVALATAAPCHRWLRFFLIPRLRQPERSWHPRTLWFTWATADSNYKVNMWVCVRVCAHPMQERLVWLHNQPPRGFTKSIKMGKGENCHVTQVCFWACKYTCIHSTTTATF